LAYFLEMGEILFGNYKMGKRVGLGYSHVLPFLNRFIGATKLNAARLAGGWLCSAEPIFCQTRRRKIGDLGPFPMGPFHLSEVVGDLFNFFKGGVGIVVSGRFRDFGDQDLQLIHERIGVVPTIGEIGGI
jgi:hypothetical protein